MRDRSVQEVTLGKRQLPCGFAGQKDAIGADLIGFGVNLDRGRGVVQAHVAFADPPRVFDGDGLLGQPVGRPDIGLLRRLAGKDHRIAGDAAAKGAEHRPGMHRLRRGDAGIRVAHLGHDDCPADQHHFRLCPEKSGGPQDQIGALAFLD